MVKKLEIITNDEELIYNQISYKKVFLIVSIVILIFIIIVANTFELKEDKAEKVWYGLLVLILVLIFFVLLQSIIIIKMLIKFYNLMKKYRIHKKIRGILHVGAHECEEKNDYEKI